MTYKLSHKHVKKVTFTLEDGTEETWEFPPEDRTALYRISSNRKTAGRGNPTIIESWKEHILQWTSERQRAADAKELVPTVKMVPQVDAHGRSTGFLVPETTEGG